ncbi:hypothetical protein O6H91_19G049900 [Diphasiastrum complanatum]|uniref:Uncharacterized protein n=2 Tax=Diphasiastrum complanatum TaxID=34168 RepID=A0ACC2AVW4_DIPCM|nr:hypothetical protein O6H91_19G049900 [Diphasiastrum complanatum]
MATNFSRSVSFASSSYSSGLAPPPPPLLRCFLSSPASSARSLLHFSCGYSSSFPIYALRLSAISLMLAPVALVIHADFVSCSPTASSDLRSAAPVASSSSSSAALFTKRPLAILTGKILPNPKWHATGDETLDGVCSVVVDDVLAEQFVERSVSEGSGSNSIDWSRCGKTLVGADHEVVSHEESNYDGITAVLLDIGITPEGISSMHRSHHNLFNATTVELVTGIRTLEELGLNKGDIARVIGQFPLLLLKLDEKLRPLMQLFDNMGIEKTFILGRLLKFNADRATSSAEFSIRRFIDFCIGYNLSVEDAADSMRKYPQIAIFSSGNMFKVVEYMKEFNMTDQDIGILIRNHPQILTCNVDKNLKPKVSLLMELGVDRKGIHTVMRKQPQLFGSSMENSLKPKFKYLQSVGFQKTDIAKLVISHPAVLARSVTEKLVGKGELLLSLGFQKGSVQFCRALRFALAAGTEYLHRRINWFMSVGFCQDDICIMLKGNPCLLLKKETQLQAKVDYLLNSMHYPLKVLVTHPVFLNLSIEKRIKPRHRVVMWLKFRGIFKKDPSLSFFTCFSKEHFRKKYVDCHPGCSSAFEEEQFDLVLKNI